jgi:RNA ligase
MQQYPSIDGSSKAPLGKPCIAFVKYDGSNLRWEWSPKKGWHKFGTRSQLFDASDELYGQAIPIFMDTMGDEIVRRVRDLERGIQRITVFTEFFGPKSFAGQHDLADPKELKLFDAFLFKRGFMAPRTFVKTFGGLPWAAEVVYDGTLNRQFILDVQTGCYPVYEGVVAKGDDFMVKIKTAAYFNRLNEVYGTEYRNYWE